MAAGEAGGAVTGRDQSCVRCSQFSVLVRVQFGVRTGFGSGFVRVPLRPNPNAVKVERGRR